MNFAIQLKKELIQTAQNHTISLNEEIAKETKVEVIYAVYTALLVLNYIRKKKLNNLNIIEIGGGSKGEQCFRIFQFASAYDIQIKSYTIFDGLDFCMDQQKYLVKVLSPLEMTRVQFCNLHQKVFPLKSDSFLFSQETLSTASKQIQTMYYNILQNKIMHGYIVWLSPVGPNESFYEKIKKQSEIEESLPRPIVHMQKKILTF